MPRQLNSTKKTTLNAVEQYELNQWLEQNHINSTNLRRSFTDVLPLARLLSRYYPALIDLNYYPPRNSVHNKLCNWESFNKRVLARLGVHLTREQMVRVARSVPGSVDLLLYSIMRVQLAAERKAREAKDSSKDDDEEKTVNQTTGQDNDAAKKLATVDDENEDDAGNGMPSKPNMPKTLKQAQAALKRSERSQMGGHGRGVATATAIMQRARGSISSNNNRRLSAAGTDAGTSTGTGTGPGSGGGVAGASGVKRGRQTIAGKRRQNRPF